MKNMKKIGLLLALVLCLSMLLSISVLAASAPADGESGTAAVSADNPNRGDKPSNIGEAIEWALTGTATGMIMIFAVLGLLCIILYVSKYFLFDLPRKGTPEERAEKERIAAEREARKAAEKAEKEAERAKRSASAPIASPAQNDGELVAVITAAIAAMIESGEYKNEFVGGFKVVSFKRNDKCAWNRK